MDGHTEHLDRDDPGAADRSLGVRGEALARAHLGDDGLEVVASNWQLTAGRLRGELDIVAVDHRDEVVVICEVKTRRSDAFGGPLAAVTPRKQARIRRLAGAFLTRARMAHRRVRFDVIAVLLPRDAPWRLTHLPGAF